MREHQGLPRVFADFANADQGGRVRLNTVGTQKDLIGLGITLVDGLQIELSDGELATEGTVEFDRIEGWVARIEWSSLQ